MTEAELLSMLARGEDSRHQFKRDIANVDALAAELAAMANSGGGEICLGVADDGSVAGLDAAAVRRLNQLISNTASQRVRPPLHPLTENIATAHGLVLAISVADGLNKPYMDLQGRVWVKSGPDKRHVTAREELQRLFQRAGLVYADVVPVTGTSLVDLDDKTFNTYFNRRYGQNSNLAGLTPEQLLQNLGLGDGRELNLAGLLLFGKQPQRYRPAFEVKAVAFPGAALHDSRYLDSEDIDGTLLEQYQRSFAFIRRNLRHVQAGRSFNTLGQLEIPEQVLEELLVNALIHRDYFTSASIRLMLFADRLEIISPGHLPDTLNTEAIRHGATNRRNPTLTEHAVHILPYRGLGTGIPRALHDWPEIELIDDVTANQFKVIVARPKPHVQAINPAAIGVPPASSEHAALTDQVTDQVTGEVMRLLAAMHGEMTRADLQAKLGLKHLPHLRDAYLHPALEGGWIEMTIPDKPQSSKQKYRLTQRGLTWLAAYQAGGGQR